MPRHQVFELGDLPWVPTHFKHYLTDVLSIAGAVGERLGDALCLEPQLDLLAEVLGEHGQIVDLCSGAAGPPMALRRRLAARGVSADVVLTDLHPNLKAFRRAARAEGCTFQAASVDAADVPASLTGLRTIFNAFHHFPPALARRILKDAHDSRQAILIVEIPHRRVSTALSLGAFSILTLALTPLIRPASMERLLWTYILPLLPLMVGFDGIMSCIRAYDTDELAALTEGLDEDYTWQISRTRGAGALLAATVLLGQPTPRGDNAG
ncbi:MAG: class I SAM-dependent methyltransferase [Myxococcota bacterium]|nr:class I SAM-dependent methyltransferase [Myxococcota bacterium]